MNEEHLYTTREAADYLGISYGALTRHVRETGHLTPDKITGDAYVFSQSTLDEFARHYHAELGYTAQEAGEYLGVSYAVMRYYKSQGLIEPDAQRLSSHGRGRTWVYFKETLDAFRENYLDVAKGNKAAAREQMTA